MPSPQKDKRNLNDETTDKELASLIAKGNEAALSTIMLRYKYKLHAFIKAYVKNEDIAYDILQETFIKLFLKADTYNPSYKFSTWLYQIAINLCRDYGRKHKFKRLLSLDNSIGRDENSGSYIDILSDSSEDIENITSLREQLKILNEEIEKLPHKLKIAIIMYTIENHSQERCAEILGVTVKTIETRVYRARKILIEKTKEKFKD